MLKSRGLKAAGFAIGMMVAALSLYLLPFGSKTDWSVLVKARRSDASIAIVGNSIIDHTSKCDPDHRTLSELYAQYSGSAVVDLSSSGQLLHETLAYAAMALGNPDIRRIIVPISYYNLADDWLPSLQRRLFLNLVSAGAHRFPALSAGGLRGTPLWAHQEFKLHGRQYPSYEGIKSGYFQSEKRAMGCPENDGSDRQYRNAYYEHVYLSSPPRKENLDAVTAFVRAAGREQREVLVVLMPIDLELIETIDPSMAATVRERAASALAYLRDQGAEILDLSAAVSNDGFADRWCACGHLLHNGRETVARSMIATAGVN